MEKTKTLKQLLAEEKRRKGLGFKSHIKSACPYCKRSACKNREKHRALYKEKMELKTLDPQDLQIERETREKQKQNVI